MTEAEAAAQADLRQIVEELDAIRARLAEIHDRLPVSCQETAMLSGGVVSSTPKFPPCWTLIFPPSTRRRDGVRREIGEALRCP